MAQRINWNFDSKQVPGAPPNAKRRQRRAFQFVVAISVAVGVLAIVLLIAFESSLSRRAATARESLDKPSGLTDALAGLLPNGDPDLAAVRARLRENLDVADWEEVRWWPARDMVEWHQSDVKNANDMVTFWANALKDAENGSGTYHVHDAQQSLDDAKKSLEAAKRKSPQRLCRLKYRSKNKLGATELFDDFFEIVEGKAFKTPNPGGGGAYWYFRE